MRLTDQDAVGYADRRYVSPLGDRRESAVPCHTCRVMTLALDAVCDRCAGAAEISAGRTGA